MYAPNKTLPGSAWRVDHNRGKVDCICHQACFSLFLYFDFFYFSDLLPRARSLRHLTPKGEHTRYRYLLRDMNARNMYEKKVEHRECRGFPLDWTRQEPDPIGHYVTCVFGLREIENTVEGEPGKTK